MPRRRTTWKRNPIIRSRRRRERRESKQEEEEDEIGINWLDLPEDVWSLIFTKLGAFEILSTAQHVCTLWQDLSQQPHLFRVIDTKNYLEFVNGDRLRQYFELVTEAVDRSCGELNAISIYEFTTDDLLNYIIDNSSKSLKYLSLHSCDYVTGEALKKLTFLEGLHIEDGFRLMELGEINEVGVFYQLKYFGLTNSKYGASWGEEAFAIAKNMPQLRHLQLVRSWITNDGLEAILDGCPYLEHLKLEDCFGIILSEDLEKKCHERIKEFELLRDDFDAYDGCDSPLSVCPSCGYGGGLLWEFRHDEDDDFDTYLSDYDDYGYYDDFVLN